MTESEPIDGVDKLLNKIYYDPKTGFQSVDKLYRKVKAVDATANLKQVRDFIKRQTLAQITQEKRRSKHIHFDHITALFPNDIWQIDFMISSRF
jgi:hypothetical protein